MALFTLERPNGVSNFFLILSGLRVWKGTYSSPSSIFIRDHSAVGDIGDSLLNDRKDPLSGF